MSDPYTPPAGLEVFTTWGAAFMVLAGIVGALYAGMRWVSMRLDSRVEDIAKRLDERTMPIQPTANGGKSLPDAANEARKARELAEQAHDRIERVEAQGVEVLSLVRQLHQQLMTHGSK